MLLEGGILGTLPSSNAAFMISAGLQQASQRGQRWIHHGGHTCTYIYIYHDIDMSVTMIAVYIVRVCI